MLDNNEQTQIHHKYNFITELTLVKSSSTQKLNRKLQLADLDENIKRRAKSRSRSRSRGKFKKKKRNKRFKLLFLHRLNRKSNIEFEKKNNFEYKFKELFGKIIVKKEYLEELVKRKKRYSEHVKKIKIIKRHNSIKPKEDSSFDIIKKYSIKVLCTNRELINYKKEKEKELFKKLDNIERTNLKKNNFETPQIKQRFKLAPFPKKLNFTNNNNYTPIISFNKCSIEKNNNRIDENNKTNIIMTNQVLKLHKKPKLKLSQNVEKKDNILNKSTPVSLAIKPNHNRNNKKTDLNIILSSSIKNDVINHEKSLNSSPQNIEICDTSSPKKMKRERSDLCKDYHRLYYAIGPGNASYLVKNCMLHRTNWKESYSYVTNIFNFKWLQVSNGIDYFSLGKYGSLKQIVNHFENHSCITNKANLFVNMMDYCERRKISVFKYIPLTLIFELNILDNTTDEKIKKKLDKIQKFVDEDELTFVKKYEDIGKYFKENEFLEEKKRRIELLKENLNNKKNKNKILFYVKEVAESSDEDENLNYEGKYPLYRDYFGKIKLKETIETKIKNNLNSFCREKDRQKLMNKLNGTNTVIEIPDTHSSGKNMWIIKAINLNRGMCIKIVNNYKKMIYILNKFKQGVNYDFTSKKIEEIDNKATNENKKDNIYIPKTKIYSCDKLIIQKYIEKPLLYKGRKCDMRVWVLITQNLKVYFFKEGHLKTCSISFDINSEDAFSHITNYSFQKYNEYFQKYEKGNEVPFYEFQKFIDEFYPDKNFKIKVNLYSQIKEIVSISMKSVKEQINKNFNNYQFEIFGYDFMLDENFNLFLIEINTNPGLEESSPWIQIIVPRMLDDALRLTIDQLFYPGYDFSKIYKKGKKQNSCLKKILNYFKNKIVKENINKKLENETSRNIRKNGIFDEEIETNRMKTETNYIINLTEKINKKSENKNEVSKNDKYISPFPVPGYMNDDNLWEFVCDLTSKDPLDDFLDKDENKCYTGFRYLYNKKKENET